MEKCKKLMKEMFEKPLCLWFANPVDTSIEGFEEYDKIVTNPMDLGTVKSRLERGFYTHPADWYSDVVLVYENALKFHPENSIWHLIAQYCLQDFKTNAVGVDSKTEQEWLDAVDKRTCKLTKLLSQVPNIQRSNPIINNIKQQVENISLPSSQAMTPHVEKLNTMLEDDECRETVLAILKDVQGMTEEEASNQVIEIEKLTPLTQKCLLTFINTRG